MATHARLARHGPRHAHEHARHRDHHPGRPGPPGLPRCSGSPSSSLPLLFGLDKFAGFMTVNWEGYLATWVNDLVPGTAADAMMTRRRRRARRRACWSLAMPRIGGYVIAAWLAGIIVNLVSMGEYYDIALRDLGLLVGAARAGPAGHDLPRQADGAGGRLARRRPARHVALELGQPGRRAGVRRHPPVTARRHRAAGAHLRAVGQRGPLELAGEEALHEDLEPVPDRRQVVGRAAAPRGSPAATPPRSASRQACQARKAILLGPVAVAQHVEEREVLQRVRARPSPRWPAASALLGRDQLGGDLLVEDLAGAPRWCRRSNSPLSITQRIRCWISVLGTPVLTA